MGSKRMIPFVKEEVGSGEGGELVFVYFDY